MIYHEIIAALIKANQFKRTSFPYVDYEFFEQSAHAIYVFVLFSALVIWLSLNSFNYHSFHFFFY